MPRRRSAWLFGLAALAIAGAIGAALFGLPVRTWFEQDNQLGGLEHELGELQTVNDDLQNEVDRLQTDEGIVEAARDELGNIQPGDNRETMHPLPPLPRDLPDGWPYSQVGQILVIREAAAAAPTTAAADDVGGGWVEAPTTALTPTSAVAAGPTTVAATGAVTSVAAAPSTGATTSAGPSTSVPAPMTAPSSP